VTAPFDVAVVGLGGLGSAAAYWATARGANVLGLERFSFGHGRGASEDHSRIIRLSYHTPDYVRFAKDAYAAWADVERVAGEELVFRTGGIDLYPRQAYVWMDPYTSALGKAGVPHEWMGAAEAVRRWPQWTLDHDVRVMYQEDGGLVAASRANSAHRRVAAERGATLLEKHRVGEIREAAGGYELVTDEGTFRAERLIVTTDAWTNELLQQLWRPINLRVTQEQVHYYASRELDAFAPERFPVWIWMGVPSFYGFPAFGEGGAKIGWDVGGREVTGDSRSFEPDETYAKVLDGFMQEHLPGGLGPYLRRRTCLYTLTPDRDFVIDLVPGHERAAVGQGAAHAYKFAGVIGKSLVELVFDGRAQSDLSPWSIKRGVLTMASPPTSYFV
jgi:monomeric sarcosine oxidase